MKHRKPNRLPNFDYTANKLYYVTINTEHKKCFFGHVSDKIMHKNKGGDIVEEQWYWLEEQYSYITLHSFIVMPNHVHGIIEINSSGVDNNVRIKSLSQLIGAFKTTTSRLIHLDYDESFGWQRSFHDHIIRNMYEYQNIRDYIVTNPERWGGELRGSTISV